MRLARQTIEIARAIRVRDIAPDYLHAARERHKFACPCCGSSDGLHAYGDQLAHCFACGETLDAIAIVRHVTGATFAEAVRTLTGIGPEPIVRRKPAKKRTAQKRRRASRRPADHHRRMLALFEALQTSSRALDYLRGRGINPDLVESGDLRSATPDEWERAKREAGITNTRIGCECIVFAYWHPATLRLDALRLRALEPDRERAKVFSLSGSENSPRVPYLAQISPALAEHTGLPVTIVEGELDALGLLTRGIPASASPGASTWRDEWHDHFSDVGAVVIADGDDAGRRFASKVARGRPGIAAKVCPTGTDPLDTADQLAALVAKGAA